MVKDFIKTNWESLLILAILSYVLFFYGLGSYSLLDVDEPRYAEAAREILESGNWITPYFNYEPRFAKPILFYWFIAISYLMFGITEFAARFPSAICASLTVLMVYITSVRVINKQFALIASVILATSIQFLGLARMSITDMTLSFFMSSTLLTAFLAYRTSGKEQKIWWVLFYICTGLAILTKGPVGIVIPWLILLIYLLCMGEYKKTLKSALFPWGIGIITIIALPWYVLVILENGQSYINQFFLIDNFKRFTNTVSGHHGPIYFYVIVLAAGFIPWTLYLPSALYRIIKPLNLYLRANKGSFLTHARSYLQNLDKEEHLVIYSLIWFLGIFIFFSLAGTKLLTYILPLFPAIAIIIAKYMYDVIYCYKHIKSYKIEAFIFLIAIIILAYILIYHFPSLMPREAKAIDITKHIHLLVSILFVGILFKFFNAWQQHFHRAFWMLVCMITLLTYVAIKNILPEVNKVAQGDLNHYIHIANTYNNQKNPIIMFGLKKPSIVFYTQRRVEHFEQEAVNTLKSTLPKTQTVFIVTKNKYMDILYKHNLYLVKKGWRYSLFSNHALSLKGR